MPDALRTQDMDDLGVDVIRGVIFGDRRFRERPHAELEWRASGDPEQKNVRVLTGYPAVFSEWTTLYEGKSFVLREQIAPGFFDEVLGDDCHLNYSHESPSAMCRNNPHMPADKQNGPGSMELSSDAHGLRLFARIPMDDLDAQRLAPKMDNGVVDQMSFAFTVAEDECREYDGDDGRRYYDYTLNKCKRLYDVTVCPLGAYSQTEAMLRSIASQLSGRSQEGIECAPVRSQEGQEDEPVRSEEALGSEVIIEVARLLGTFVMQEPR